MKTIWKKKVSWFKPKKEEIILAELEWEYTYTNSLGNPVECIITKYHDGYVDVLNKNGVRVFKIPMKELQKIDK